MNNYLEWMNSDEYKEMAEAEDKFLAEHWANDLLDAPHALIAMIETKMARAVLGREREIIKLLEEHQMNGKTAGGFLGGCTCGEFIDDYREHLIEQIKGEQK